MAGVGPEIVAFFSYPTTKTVLTMLSSNAVSFFSGLSFFLAVRGQFTPAASVASLYSLTTSTSLPFPTATLSSSDAGSLIASEWSLSKGRIEDGATDLSFVSDPFPSSSAPDSNASAGSGPVLQVSYPAGSFNNNTGGAQFYTLWNTTDGNAFQSVLLSYEIAFDTNFQWVKGGKLPGLRGGPLVNGCDGGAEPNGTDCFSARVMWRTNAQGEGMFLLSVSGYSN